MSTLVMDSAQTELLRVLLVEDNVMDAKFITGLLRLPSAHVGGSRIHSHRYSGRTGRRVLEVENRVGVPRHPSDQRKRYSVLGPVDDGVRCRLDH